MTLRCKRLKLMNSGIWKGHIRNVSGNPVTLENALDLKTLEVQGNSVQDGTPSPENPVEAVGVGERILPVEYNQLDYIEGTGTQWINTDFRPNQNSGIYLKAQLTKIINPTLDNSGRWFCGTVSTNFLIGYTASAERYDFIITNKTSLTFPNMLDKNVHIFKNNFLNDKTFTVDNVSKTYESADYSNNYGLGIFRPTYLRENNYFNDATKARIYSFKFSQGNEVVADLIPAQRISDNKVGMYDIINDTFYSSAGAAEFLPGNSIEIYKIPVEVTGKNLFTFAKLTYGANASVEQNGNSYILNNNGYYTYSSTKFEFFNLSPQTQYTLFYKYKVIETEIESVQSRDDKIYSKISDKSSNILVAYSKRYSDISVNTEHSVILNFTTGDISECFFQANLTWDQPRKTKMVVSDIMIIEGSYTAEMLPSYEPYKEPQTFNVYIPEPLHGVGDAHDMVMIDFDNKTAKLYQKTNIKQYTSAVKNREIRGDYCLYYLDTDTDKKQMIQCKCNLFESTYAMTGDINSVFLSQYDAHPSLLISIAKNIIGYDDTTDDVDSGRIKLNNWLLQKQTEGTPLTVTYALSDDYITTTDITALQQWDSLPNLKGTWILTAIGGTEPNLNVTYYSTIKE